ncbi:hypothetical protein [Thalassovita taeanensis]|uniref:hypothetical protein n=1 Tax=Thalassovita taeanensis TaxID=657014 RepID=UPI0015877F7E|nr:hypothetical protein [Thalassovita taeanensis]
MYPTMGKSARIAKLIAAADGRTVDFRGTLLKSFAYKQSWRKNGLAAAKDNG